MARKVIQINKNPVYEIGMITTVFSKDTEFYGDLKFKKSLQINGYMEGEINSDGFLVVGEGAVVRANVRAKTVIISGEVHGNVEATDRLEIDIERSGDVDDETRIVTVRGIGPRWRGVDLWALAGVQEEW